VLGPTDAGGLDAAADAGAPDAAGDAARDVSRDATGTECNVLVNAAPPITVGHIDGAPPTPAGGAILDGTYFLTSRTAYRGAASGCAGPGHPEVLIAQGVMVISAGATGVQGVEADNTHGDAHYTASLHAAGTTATLTRSCPAAQTATGPYSADVVYLALYDTASCYYDTYMRQP
jgi:hypothetical protein